MAISEQVIIRPVITRSVPWRARNSGAIRLLAMRQAQQRDAEDARDHGVPGNRLPPLIALGGLLHDEVRLAEDIAGGDRPDLAE